MADEILNKNMIMSKNVHFSESCHAVTVTFVRSHGANIERKVRLSHAGGAKFFRSVSLSETTTTRNNLTMTLHTTQHPISLSRLLSQDGDDVMLYRLPRMQANYVEFRNKKIGDSSVIGCHLDSLITLQSEEHFNNVVLHFKNGTKFVSFSFDWTLISSFSNFYFRKFNP